jgi:hypothetical protein
MRGHQLQHYLPLHRGPWPLFSKTYFSALMSSAWSATIPLKPPVLFLQLLKLAHLRSLQSSYLLRQV